MTGTCDLVGSRERGIAGAFGWREDVIAMTNSGYIRKVGIRGRAIEIFQTQFRPVTIVDVRRHVSELLENHFAGMEEIP